MSETAEATNEVTENSSSGAQPFLEAAIEQLTNLDSPETKALLHGMSKAQWESYKNSFIPPESKTDSEHPTEQVSNIAPIADANLTGEN